MNIKPAHQLLEELQAENAVLKLTINKRNRHVQSLKAIIQDLKAQTKIIFESEDI